MIDRSTSVRGALRQRQRGFIINPFRFGGGGGVGSLYDEIIADSPWAYYQLGETAGATSFADSSGNSRNLGTVVATVTSGVTGLVSPGTCTEFDGAGGRITCSNNEFGAAADTAFSGDKAVTIVAVVRFDSVASQRVLFHIGNVNVSNSQGFFVEQRASGVLRFQMLVNAAYKNIDSSASSVAAATTYILHFRRAVGGTGSIWVNGVNVTSGSTDLSGSIRMAATSTNGGSRIMLGALNGTTPSLFTDGKVQHLAVFNSALSNGRIGAQVLASGL